MHYDLYRLKSDKEVQQLDIFGQEINSIKIIEWAKIIKNKPENRLEIYLTYNNIKDYRNIKFKGFGRWKDFDAS